MKKIFALSIAWTFLANLSFANCPDVTGLQATNLNGTDVLLSWDGMPGATQYQLKVEQEETASPFVFWLSLSDNSHLLEGLDPNGVYKFKVRTICGGEKASWSEYQFFTSNGSGTAGNGGTGVCQEPGQLVATIDANGVALLSWDGVAGALLYEVEVESEENTPFFYAEFQTIETFAELAGLVPNGLYKFKVKSQCGGSNSSDYSPWTFFPGTGGNGGTGGGNGLCDTPTGLTVSDITSGSALISWDAMPGAVAYEIEVEDDENTPAFAFEMTLTDNQVTVTGLTAGGHYQVKVKAKCSADNSLDSEWVFFTAAPNFGGGGTQSLVAREGGQAQTFRLSPNPAYPGEPLLIKTESTYSAEKIWIGIYDLQGRLQRSLEASPGELEYMQLPTSGLRAGMYQVVIRSKNEVQARRLSLLD